MSVVGFNDGNPAQLGILAGTCNARAAARIENCTVMRADQVVIVIGQKAIGGKIERSALVRAKVVPGPGLSPMPGYDQPDGLTVVFDLEFAILPFGQFANGTQEHWLTHGV